MLYNSIEKQIYGLACAGVIGDDIINALVPNGRMHDFESWVFDYKLSYHLAREEKPIEIAISELIKDFVAFYNSLGGYILVGHPCSASPPSIFTAISDCDNLIRRLESFSGTSIPIRIFNTSSMVNDENHSLICIYIPKRPAGHKPIAFAKNSYNKGNAKSPQFVFKKNDIYVRKDFECVPANNDLELLSFAFSERNPESLLSIPNTTENNLPSKDPNLIRFVGRRKYLEDLWAWIADFRSPIRVLTASGGIGKTAIAYEFASQVVDHPGATFEKVVWLSGKKMTYSPLRGTLEPTTRCDFNDVDTFLDALLLDIGNPKAVIESLLDRDEKLSCVVESLSTFGVLLIVDDVDSLNKDDQNDLFAILSDVAIRASHANTITRVLFTSRLELLTGAHQRIEMEGFIGDEFTDFLQMIVSYFITDHDLQERIISAKAKIYDASGGSAIFIASIVRLVSLGYDLTKAIQEWKGKKGEQVRAFAFQREIKQLSESQREILYAIQLLSRARIDEIREICGLAANEIDEELGKLREYHLYSVKESAVSGTILEVPEPIRLMHDITGQSLASQTRTKIEAGCARVRRIEKDPDRNIGIIIGQTIAHWRDGHPSLAVTYLDQQIRKYNKSGELYCLRARSKMMLGETQFVYADADFSSAEKYGCDKIILLKHWCSLKIKRRDWRGLNRLVERTEGFDIHPLFAMCFVFSLMKLGDKSLDGKSTPDAINFYEEAIKVGASFIGSHKVSGYYYQIRNIMQMSASQIIAIRKGRESIEELREIFSLAGTCVAQKFAPSFVLLEGLQALRDWLADFGGDRRMPSTMRIRLADELHDIRHYLQSQSRLRSNLLLRCDELIRNLQAIK